ncbi:hypothetical protein ACWKWU_16490 [Chitinophaga lutea]
MKKLLFPILAVAILAASCQSQSSGEAAGQDSAAAKQSLAAESQAFAYLQPGYVPGGKVTGKPVSREDALKCIDKYREVMPQYGFRKADFGKHEKLDIEIREITESASFHGPSLVHWMHDYLSKQTDPEKVSFKFTLAIYTKEFIEKYYPDDPGAMKKVGRVTMFVIPTIKKSASGTPADSTQLEGGGGEEDDDKSDPYNYAGLQP